MTPITKPETIDERIANISVPPLLPVRDNAKEFPSLYSRAGGIAT
jgi:hypothetical protein